MRLTSPLSLKLAPSGLGPAQEKRGCELGSDKEPRTLLPSPRLSLVSPPPRRTQMTPSWWITAPQTKTAILKAPLKSRQRVSALLQDVEEGREGVEGGVPEVGGDEDLLQIKLKREFTATS